MRRFLFGIWMACTSVVATVAVAQPAGFEFVEQKHRLEIIPIGGYVWSQSLDGFVGTTYGKFDVKSSGFYGVAVDINARPGFQLELLWQRQDTELEFKSGGSKQSLGDMAIEYWQIGGVTGVQRDNVMPFTGVTLGGVRVAPDQGDDAWKFGVILSLGAKVYLSERVGIRVQGRLPWIITNFGAGIGIGTGGVSAGLGGSGVLQADVSGGLIVTL